MDGFSVLNVFSSLLTPLVAVAAPIVAQPQLPVDSSYTLLATSAIYSGDFSSDPQIQRDTPTNPEGSVTAFVYGGTPQSSNEQTFRVVLRNKGPYLAEDVTLVAQVEPGIVSFTAEPSPYDYSTDPSFAEFSWLLPSIPPDNFTFVDITIPETTHELFAEAAYHIGDSSFRTSTARIAGGNSDDIAAATTTPEPSPAVLAVEDVPSQPAIICDPAEIGCTQIIPNLGLNFQSAVQNQSYPLVCSVHDPRGCTDQRPQLGKRFREAIAVTEPGECRVEEDARISEPAFHDSFLRKREPAAFYLRPLYDSGQDFKQLIQLTSLDAIAHLALVRDTLFPQWMDAWRTQNQLIERVEKDEIPGVSAVNELRAYLTQWQNRTRAAQQGLIGDYQNIRPALLSRYDEAAQKAVANARESILRACGEINGEDEALRIRLEEIKEQVFIPLIDSLINRYVNITSPQFAALQIVQNHWETILYPALRAYDAGDKEPLGTYTRTKILNLFDRLYLDTYVLHTNTDYDLLDQFRLTQWEIALDDPKTVATTCEFQNKVVLPMLPVETTVCESGTYPESLNIPPSNSSKVAAGAAQPPDTSGLSSNTTINPRLVLGTQCGGEPGDPFWATDCSCNCADGVSTIDHPDLGPILACNGDKPILRHDIEVTTIDECLQDPQPGGHFRVIPP